MKKRPARYSIKAGLPPESLVYTGSKSPSPAEMDVIVYDASHISTIRTRSASDLSKIIDKSKVNLLIIDNLTDVILIEEIGKFFNIQGLLLEDVLNTNHIPKAQESGDHLMLTMKLFELQSNGDLATLHVSLILGEYFVLIFKDFDKPVFRELINRISSGNSRARHRRADYLFYLLMDALVDSYFEIADVVNDRIDKLEEQLLEQSQTNYIHEIYHIKQVMSELRGVIFPVREALLNVVQGDYARLGEDTLPYLQDVKDHINHMIHMYELSRDTLSDLIELNSSNINNKLNNSMNILTIITTLFIPLTLIAGIYGMNFRFMPELNWKLGYPFAGMLMAVTAVIMILIMKRKKLL